ncbi:MAG TPA: hypothetical protein VIA62_12650 [Thermoanaerobaculia bacterium]|jgi:hypothetical protein|nr:hypothetical protein [Thermoanaerobaculia bacterium]
MKKQMKKLTLNRETLHRLETPEYRWVRGARLAPESGEDTCGACDSFASCTELQEDCCVGTMMM